MQILLKNVTRAWAEVVQKLASPDEVNLWHVGKRRAWRVPAPGDLVLFRIESRTREIAGYGRFIATTCHSPQEAWDLFAFANGAWSLEGLLAQVEARWSRADGPAPMLANTLIAQPVFFPPLNPFELPDVFPTNRSAVRLCSAWSRPGRILISRLRHHAGRSLVFGQSPQARLLGYRTYRVPGTVVRVDGRTLRSIVSELYDHRCAISGDRVKVTFDAVHAWPREFGGPDDLGNMMLLTVDLHRLWDAGLIAVDERHRLMVSQEVLLSGSDVRYRVYAGKPLRRRKAGHPYPDAANLRWNQDRFKGPSIEP